MADSTILIHGRSSYFAEVSFKDETGTQVDLSTKTLFFETKNAAFRKALTASVKNPLNATIHLTVEEVDLLPTSVTPFIIRDETVVGGETVIGSGSIQRTGWAVSE